MTRYSGLSRLDGTRISGEAHLAQSVQDILTTPIGSRVMRRDYGSRLPRLIDAPMTGAVRAEIVAAVAEALRAWEPRLILKRVQVHFAEAGNMVLGLEGDYDGRAVALEVTA